MAEPVTQGVERPEPYQLAYRQDAFALWRHVPSDLRFAGEDGAAPTVSIVLPTFRRTDLLAEAVRSAMEQDFEHPVEIVVVDNDPNSAGADRLLELLPDLRRRNFRYYANRENIGMYPNHNRGLELARGEWVTILNDDDLLDPDFLRTMFAALARRPAVRGLVCRKRTMDERGVGALPRHPLPRRLAAAMLVASYYRGREMRPIPLSKLFWGPLAGNCVGFLFRRDAAMEIGGFYPEEENSADYWFYARFAQRFGLWQLRTVKATVRIAQNESAKPAVLESFFRQSYRLQQTLAGAHLPGWYRRFSPMMIARQHGEYRLLWRTDISRASIEDDLGIRLPNDRPLLYRAVRLALRGF